MCSVGNIMSVRSLVFSVYAILFASMLQAQEIGMHSIENPNAVHGVYSIGNQPVLLGDQFPEIDRILDILGRQYDGVDQVPPGVIYI